MILIKPDSEKCPKCGCEIWAFDAIYEIGMLVDYCKNCGYRSVPEIIKIFNTESK